MALSRMRESSVIASSMTSRISMVGSIGLSSLLASRNDRAERKLPWFRIVAWK